MSNISDLFNKIYKDGKLFFLILLSLLLSCSVFIPVDDLIAKLLIITIPQSFAWVVIAWIITDKSVLRQSLYYITIFILGIVQFLFPVIIYYTYPEADFNAVYNFYILTIFVTTLIFLNFLWFLTQPKEFKNKTKKRKKQGQILLSIIFLKPIIISYLVQIFTGQPLMFHLSNITDNSFFWYDFIIIGLFSAIGLILFSNVITNLKTNVKYYLYGLIGIFAIVQYLPYNHYFFSNISMGLEMDVFSFIVYFVSNFMIFLSILLLAKPEYVE